MSKELLIELFGYLGSFLVLISFLMTSVVKLRVINTIGSVIFMIYALIIKSYPTAVMNGALVIVNIYYLYKLSRVDNEYDVVKVSCDDPMTEYFLYYYKEDLDRFFGDIDLSSCDTFYMPVCQGKPVGLTAGIRDKEKLKLVIDYTIAEYRDFTIGNLVFDQMRDDGIRDVAFNGSFDTYKDYYDRFNFFLEDDCYVKRI